MEAADEDGFPQNMFVNSDENLGTSGTLIECKSCIQREKLKSIMMKRAWRGRAGTQVANSAVVIFCLDGAVFQPSRGRNAFRQLASRARNVERHPVHYIGNRAVNRFVEIVQDQDEALRARRDVGPFERRRNGVRAGRSELGGDHGAIGETGTAKKKAWRRGNCGRG